MKKQLLRTLIGVVSLVLLAGLLSARQASAQGITEKTLALSPFGPVNFGQMGTVEIKVKNGQTTLEFSLSGLNPNTVGTVWEILDTTQPPFSNDATLGLIATDTATGTVAKVAGAAPAAADNAGFTAGNGLDPNGFVTDANGDAEFKIKLNYDIFQPGVAPVVLRPGVAQASACFPTGTTTRFPFIMDSAYMHVFDNFTSPSTTPSFPVLEGPLKAKLVRGNVTALVLVEHLDGLTHGHLPGVGVAQSNCGDHAARLRGKLADAVPED